MYQCSLGTVLQMSFRLVFSPSPASRNSRHPPRGAVQEQLKCNTSFESYNLPTCAFVGGAEKGVSDGTNGVAECK